MPAAGFEIVCLAAAAQESEQEGVLCSRNPHIMSAHLAPTAVGDRVGAMHVFKVYAPKGFQRRSKLKKGLCDYFDKDEATTNKCVLCGHGGIGKSTVVIFSYSIGIAVIFSRSIGVDLRDFF